jgi:DnaJ like chaperone protein
MSWLGKLAGGFLGLLAGGPIGAALGAALGHQLDQSHEMGGLGFDAAGEEEYLSSFIQALFLVMGAIAKADGRVTEAEIHQAVVIMDRLRLPEPLRVSSMRLFYAGKEQDSVLSALLPVLALFAKRPHLARRFIELETEVALADGYLHPAKESLMLEMCRVIGFSRYEFHGIRTRLEAELRFAGFGARGSRGAGSYESQAGRKDWRRYAAPPPSEGGVALRGAYALLGVLPQASDAEFKQAYRRLISQHHPDKLEASGASATEIERATQKAQEIQKAYELVSKSRGLP